MRNVSLLGMRRKGLGDAASMTDAAIAEITKKIEEKDAKIKYLTMGLIGTVALLVLKGR